MSMAPQAPTSEVPLLEARGLGRSLPGDPPVRLVEDINLIVRPGRFTTIVGPSGCGKSSLLYLLGMIDRPTSGELFFQGREVSKASGDERSQIRLAHFGFVFQFHFLLPEFSALENIMLPIRRLGALSPAETRARATALLESLGLAEKADKTPDQLSGGERQRVAEELRALAHDQGRAVVIVTHDPGIAAIADIRVEMLDGRIERVVEAG